MRPTLVISLVLTAALNAATAQELAPAAAPADPAAIQQRIQSVTGELQQTEEKVLADHPELVEQRDDYQTLLTEAMAEQGTDPAVSVARLKEIREQAQNAGQMPDAEKQALAREFQKTRRDLIEARQAAMEDSDVTAARETYQSNLLEAMKEENPDTPQLLAELQDLQSELRAKIARQQRQRSMQ